MIVYLIGIIFLITVINFQWKNRKLIQLSKVLKNDLLSLPVLGVSYLFFGNGEKQMKAIKTLGREAIKNKGITSIRFAHRFFVIVADPVAAEHISKVCLDKDNVMTRIIRSIVGNSTFVAPVPIWRPRRKIMTEIFSPKYINNYMKISAEQAQVLAEQLRPTVGKTISIYDNVSKLTMETICQTTFGTRFDIQRKPAHPFIASLQEGIKMIAERMVQPWLHYDLVYQMLPKYKKLQKIKAYGLGFTDELIKIQRKNLKEQDMNKAFRHSTKTFLELLIEVSGGELGYSNLELREECLILITAGTDTTGVGISFVIILLSQHPDVQEKVYEELKEVLGDDHGPIVAEDLHRLIYLDAVIKECFRLYPPVPIVVRHVHEDTNLPSGLVLPKGCGVVLHFWAINRNPLYWGADADQFRPERFLDTSVKHPAQYVAFGTGPRNCVGYRYALMMSKTVVATLLRQYRFRAAVDPDQPLRVKYEVMMKHVDNFPVILETRT